jgi:hypothetical protein
LSSALGFAAVETGAGLMHENNRTQTIELNINNDCLLNKGKGNIILVFRMFKLNSVFNV